MKYYVYDLQDRSADGTVHGQPMGELLIQEGEAVWNHMSPEFQMLGLPCCEHPLRFSEHGGLEKLEPYSEEAMTFLAREALPARGFVLIGPSPTTTSPLPNP